MSARSTLILSLGIWLLPAVLVAQGAQNAAPTQAPGGRGAGAGGGGAQGRGAPPAYPQRTPDPAMVERGKALYGVNCAFCHGADTRGGDTGPSLLRSQLVQDDNNGETIAPVFQRNQPPMPKFEFTAAQAADIAAFLHSFTINSRDPARVRPESILTGDVAAGKRFFDAKCASCHSATGNLKGFAEKVPDPRNLQQWWLLPGGGGGRGRGGDVPPPSTVPPITATVTLRTGQRFEGRLMRIDEFSVSVVDADGITRSFRRDGENPNVDVHDPLEPHKALLRVYTDKDIHDVTAYLVTLK
jgi:mono/diheme cytochrome c family protein